jgi:riboflavin synthase
MFTGLIKATCKMVSTLKKNDGMTLAIELTPLDYKPQIGDSIAVNGVCLTVSNIKNTIISFDVSPQTLDTSNLENLKPAQIVNIEPAMTPADRFGGHFVLGHIDGTATIKNIEKSQNFCRITFQPQPHILQYIIPKGSIAIDGISLTIADIQNNTFDATIIPQTLADTNLAHAKINQTVNIETDIIVKTVKSQLNNILPENNLTIDKLKNAGF